MAKQIDINDPFATDLSNPAEVDQTLYGAVDIGKKAKRDRIRNIDINAISPDPMQPRRVVPTLVRQASDGTPLGILSKWFELVEEERANRFAEAIQRGDILESEAPEAKFPLHVYMFSGDTERAGDNAQPDFGYLESSLLKVVDLASSIHRDGLTNPISVASVEGETEKYVIETGERRWLAYHLLEIFFEDEDYSKIPVRLVDEVSIWRQAAENNARDNLNAISRARQLAILLMDLHGWDNFQSLSDFDHEQDFYAQVGDGNQWGVPRGKGEQLVNAMGLKNNVQIRQYRALLRVPRELWLTADDRDMTEREIRDLMSQGSVTPVTVREQSGTSFDRRFAKLEREFNESRWKKLSSDEKQHRYETIQSLLNMMEAWGLD